MLRCDLVLQHRPPQGPLRIGWFFTAEGWPGARHPATPDTVRNAEPHKHDELVWADPDNPPHDLVAYTRAALDAIRAGTPYALHLQQPHDTVHDDGNAPQRLVAIRASDHGNEPLRRELGLRAAPRMGRRWVWHPDEPVPGSLRVAQSSGWLFADDGRVLLVADEGMLALPGGGTEDEDGDAWATLTREAYEEAGAVLGTSTYLGYLHDHDALVHGGTSVARARYAARLTGLGPATAGFGDRSGMAPVSGRPGHRRRPPGLGPGRPVRGSVGATRRPRNPRRTHCGGPVRRRGSARPGVIVAAGDERLSRALVTSRGGRHALATRPRNTANVPGHSITDAADTVRPAPALRPAPGGAAQTPEETSAFSSAPVSLPSAAASLRLRRTEEKKDQPIRTTPTRPVMTSWISYWMVTSRMAARAPIA